MISRMGFSLSLCPDFKQKRLQSFEVGAQRLFASFNVLFGAIPVFDDKRQASATVKWDQGLDNVVAIDGRLVIGRSELENGPGPQLGRIVKFVDTKRSNTPYVRKHRG